VHAHACTYGGVTSRRTTRTSLGWISAPDQAKASGGGSTWRLDTRWRRPAVVVQTKRRQGGGASSLAAAQVVGSPVPASALGLALVADHVARHDGTVHIETRPRGRGARFVIELPVPAS
jgi:hypothetical protein